MLESLLEFIGEFLLQAMIQVLVELGFRALAEPFRQTPNPVVAAVGHGLLGAMAGALSLWVVPAHFVVQLGWRAANLFSTPIAVGFVMVTIGALRAKQGQSVLRIDRFAYGYLFALGLALVRFFFAK
ncbi:MAG TPA: hypothetical protein VGT79_10055 [Xanthomonadaceae bacterium]|nr:hypothetical protein [Xanthomonadaceae bacterium]